MKIAEALLYRKQCEAKVQQLTGIKQFGETGALELKVQRIKINDEIEEAKLTIPRVTMEEVTREYDFWAGELRKVDAAIQEANWKYTVNFMEGKRPEIKKEKESDL